MANSGKNVLRGRFSGNARGFGFVTAEEGNDIYIPSDETLGAMDGDIVVCKISSHSVGEQRREGKITEIEQRAHQRVIGRFTKLAAGGYVEPDTRKLFENIIVKPQHTMDATSGQKVVLSIVKWSNGIEASEGEVTVVLGSETEPGVDILSVLWQNAISVDFPEAVKKAAELLPEVPVEADFIGRRDLRSLLMVTIDGEDARDLDDAVSLELLSQDRVRLGVHIADVAHYVKEGSALDVEALSRGTSVYLPDRVIPMFPEALSNGLCSLTAKVPRLALSVTMELNGNGEVIKHDIFESVINVDLRMTYTQVKVILGNEEDEAFDSAVSSGSTEGGTPENEVSEPLRAMLLKMGELASVLRERRLKRGSIDFSFDESKVVIDGAGHPIEIVRVKPNEATRLIEEFMLLCNETVSLHYTTLKIPFVYRIHEYPSAEKMQALREFMEHFGFKLRHAANVHPSDLQEIINKIKGKPEEKTISTMMLRSLQKARYSHEHIWHFGLAADHYSHFTSPIRRYPDLQIHRIIKETIHNRMDEKRKAHYKALLPEATKHCSERERAADSAERECVDMKKAEYMEAHLGETFSGTVSGVSSFGMFVELENSVEGLLRISELGSEYFVYDDRTMTLRGERSGKLWRIGDKISVIVAKASAASRQIDFIPADSKRDSNDASREGRLRRRSPGAGSVGTGSVGAGSGGTGRGLGTSSRKDRKKKDSKHKDGKSFAKKSINPFTGPGKIKKKKKRKTKQL